jgi:hypothetical protein
MTRVLTLSLAALALLAAGCGGDDGSSKEDYEREVQAVGDTLQRTFGELGSSISGSGSTEQAATKLEEGAASLDKAAADFRDIEPPSDIEDSHNQIVSGLQALADEFRKGAQAAEGGDLQELLQFAQGLQGSDAVRQVTEAGNDIESKGYDFNTSTSDDGGGSE